MLGEFLRLFDLGDAPQSWYDGAGVPKSGPDKAIIEITYRSVYGDRWRVTSDSRRAEAALTTSPVTEHSLVPHRSSTGQAPLAIAASVELERTRSTLRFSYRLTGDVSQLAIPHRWRSQRAERLWEHTCFEAFIAPGAAARYFELNFSPSTQWAAYAFDGYRQGMRPLALARPPSIAVDAKQPTSSV